MNTEDLITVATFGNPQEAYIAKNALEVEGLYSFLMAHETANTLWHVGTALGGTKLQVRKVDQSFARDILQRLRQTNYQSSSAVWICSNCGEEVEQDFEVCWSCCQANKKTDDRSNSPSQPDLDPKSELQFQESNTETSLTLAEDDDLAIKAWRASVFGIFFPLLYLYSIFAVIQLNHRLISRGLSSHAASHFYGAIVISFLMSCLMLALALTLAY